MSSSDDGGAAPAFAKLQGRWMYHEPGKSEEFEAMIRTTTVRLGRVVGEDSAAGADFISLGDTKLISRHHATISWIEESDSWQITCMSKNGLVVDKMFFVKGETVPLVHKSTVKLGPCAFYFLLPNDGEMEKAPGKQKTYGELVKEAFASGAFDDAEGVTSLDLKDWVVANVPSWQSVTSDQQIKLLTTGIQAVLYREKGYEKLQSKSQKYSMWRRVDSPPLEKNLPPPKRFAAASPRDGPLPVSKPAIPQPTHFPQLPPQQPPPKPTIPTTTLPPPSTLPPQAEAVAPKPLPPPPPAQPPHNAQAMAVVSPPPPQQSVVAQPETVAPRPPQPNSAQVGETVSHPPPPPPTQHPAAAQTQRIVAQSTTLPQPPAGQAEGLAKNTSTPLEPPAARTETVARAVPAQPPVAQAETVVQPRLAPEPSAFQTPESAVNPPPAGFSETVSPSVVPRVALAPEQQPPVAETRPDNHQSGFSPPASDAT